MGLLDYEILKLKHQINFYRSVVGIFVAIQM